MAEKIIDLTPVNASEEQLGPTTIVVAINRGVETLERKFDGLDYKLPPHTEGLLSMPYAAALHFQRHCPVPSSRDVFTGEEDSFIGIIRTAVKGVPIDPPAWCVPFTPEQCERFGQAIEAIQRQPDEEVQVASVGAATAAGRIPVRGQSAGRRRMVREEQAGKSGVTAKQAMAPPDDENDAQAEIRATTAEMAEAGEP